MSAGREERKRELLAFLRSIQKAGRPVESLADDERLVRSGLIDSLAILQIITFLEEKYSIDFAAAGVDPEQLGSIGGILDVIELQTA